MSGVPAIIVGGALTAAAFIPGLQPLAATGFLFAGTTLIKRGLTPKKFAEAYELGLDNIPTPLDRLPVAYGASRLGITPVFIGENNKILWIAGALCHGSQDGSGIDGIGLTLFDGIVAITTLVQPPWDAAPSIAETRHLGLDPQTVDAGLDAAFSQWTAAHTGKSIVYIVMQMIDDPKVFPTGVPIITNQLTGMRVLDVRTSTVGYSQNPALCIYDYLTSTVYGLGIPTADVDDASFIVEANYCDELVTVPDGAGGSTTQERFKTNGWIDQNDMLIDNLEKLKATCRAQIVYQGGQHRISIRKVAFVVPSVGMLELTEDNFHGDIKIQSPGVDEAFNTMEISYVRNNKPDMVIYPRPGATNAFLTLDNGWEAPGQAVVSLCDDVYQAEQLAMVALKESRLDKIQATVDETIVLAQIGDRIFLTHSFFGWSQKEVWVLGLELRPDGLVDALFLEYDPQVYSLDPQDDAFADPVDDLPDPFSVGPPTSVVGVDILIDTGTSTLQPAINLTWTDPTNANLSHFKIRAKRDGITEPWRWYPNVLPAIEEAVLDNIFYTDPIAGTDWEVEIFAVSTLGAQSSVVSTIVNVDGAAVIAPSNVSISSGTNADRIHVIWQQTTDANIDFYEVQVRHNSTGAIPPAENGADVWEAPETVTRFQNELYINGPRQGQSWRARVRTVNTAGDTSIWVESADHVVTIHGTATPTFGTPQAGSGGITYSITLDDFTDYVEVYSRTHATTGQSNPIENTQYLVTRWLVRSEPTYTIPTVANQFRRTLLVAYNRFGERGIDNGVVETQGVAGAPLTAPNTLASPAQTGTTVDLTWVNGDGTAETWIYKNGQHFDTVTAGGTAVTATGLEPNTSYDWDIRHHLAGDFSPFAGILVQATGVGTLGAPTAINGFGSGSTGAAAVTITWELGTDGQGADYSIERSATGTGGWGNIGDVGAGVLMFQHVDNAELDNEFFFRVIAHKSGWNDSPPTGNTTATYTDGGLI